MARSRGSDALVNQSLQSLTDGVSEQPATQRSEAQAEAQVNCVSDVAKGVARRTPFEHIDLIAELAAALPS